MSIDPKDLAKIIDYTRGTCQSLEEVLVKFGYDYDDLDLEAAVEVDEHIFCCGACGWWCETSEMADDWEDFTDEPACEDCVRYDLS